jgi:hypothetical protein
MLAGAGAEKCVAIHVRRGDRVGEFDTVEKMREHCKLQHDTDKGCGQPESTWWAGITLESYLERAQEHLDALGGGNTIFIMAQDEMWLDEQMKKYPDISSKFNIYQLAGDRGSMHWEERTQQSIDFWASIRLAQRCSAMVGHFGSAVSRLLYRSMCNQHAGLTATCPPGTSMSTNPGAD